MNATALIALLALLVAAGGGFWLAQEHTALQERIATLEAAAAGGGEADAADADAGPTLQGSSVRRDLAELRGTADALMTRMERIEDETRSAAKAPASRKPGPKSATGTPAFAEAVREVVLEMAENDVDFRARVGTGERTKMKDAPFAQVAETLKLDASQEAAMAKDLQAIQQDLFTALSEERPDGLVPMQEIMQMESLPEGDPRRAETFMKLFTLKIPGGEETYMQRAIKLTQRFRKKADTYLRAEQREILNAVEIDWFSIKFD